MNDIDFGEYVEDILTRMMNGDDDYRSMISGNARKIGVTVIWWFTITRLLQIILTYRKRRIVVKSLHPDLGNQILTKEQFFLLCLRGQV